MSVRTLVVFLALLSAAGAARAGLTSAMPESATVTVVFIALAAIGLAYRRKPKKTEAADVA